MSKITPLSSFNHYPTQTCHLQRPERYRELYHINKNTIARGNGKSYGDAALNENGHVLLMERLDRFIAFDPTQGILTAEAGVTLAKILSLITSSNWFLPVTPGTQFVTLGGCIAADVHGKNHHHDGSFAEHVLWFELITANGQTLQCSPTENSDLFWATCGGMGLTGIIGKACLKLKPIQSIEMQVKHHIAKNLNELLELLIQPEIDDEYSVAWIDTLAKKQNFGRGIVMNAHHSPLPTLSIGCTLKKHFSVPFHMPHGLLNSTTQKLFNDYYYWSNKKADPFLTTYQQYFYPLDSIENWNRLYGKKGFLQYQCVLSLQQAQAGYQELLEYLQNTQYPAFLAVIKRLRASNNGLLSFPMEGITLALDLPLKDSKLFTTLNNMDAIVMKYDGRIYLAKDARLAAKNFQTMYPRYQEWRQIKKRIDPQVVFNSSLAQRLEMC